MKKYHYKNTLIGIKITRLSKNTNPVTDAKEPLQILAHRHNKGKYIDSHSHIPKRRITHKLQECIILLRGKLRLDLYGPDKKHVKHIYLKERETFILLSGGWSVKMITDSEFIEIKNGPYLDDKIMLGL